MSESAYDELARDRLVDLLDASPQLATSMYGLTRQLVRVLDERNAPPEAVKFEPVHLDAHGLAMMRFHVRTSARAKLPYRAPWSAESASAWVHGGRAIEAQFLRRCPTWRSAIVQTYDKAFRLGRDTGVPFRALSFGIGRVNPSQERAWLRVFKSPLEKSAASLLGV